MPNYEEIKAQIEALEIGNTLSKKSEVKELPKILLEGENIIAVAKGRYNKQSGIIVVTSSRIILMFKILFSSKTEEFHFNQITSIEHEKVPPLGLGKIKVLAMGNEAVIDNMDYKESDKMAGMIRGTMAQSKAPSAPVQSQSDDAFAKLEKLKKLHENKVISDAEFESKKNEILSTI
ncbi:PH domain-containing protein [Paenibacillus sp. SAF-054]|uniref:PH domain-containing protein n=1 Tax=unclassified Paenibacillus TaxID=185978 RepID=UPI003F800B4B